jgi:hypothetical protein
VIMIAAGALNALADAVRDSEGTAALPARRRGRAAALPGSAGAAQAAASAASAESKENADVPVPAL